MVMSASLVGLGRQQVPLIVEQCMGSVIWTFLQHEDLKISICARR